MLGLTRREAVLGALGGMVAAPLAGEGTSSLSLNAIATRKGLSFGSAIASGAPGADRGSVANPAYANLVASQCGLVVAENEMKWQALRPTPTTFAFERFDTILRWAERQHLAVRGHNLLWHQPKWLPAWLNTYDFGATPHREAERLLTTHINTVLRRYGQRIGSYDVVNEAVRPADGVLYDTSLSRALGGAEPTLDLAFHTARVAAPHAQLVYNDYMSWEPGNAAHRAGVLRLLEGFRRRNVPIDALGIQSHLVTQGPDVAASVTRLQRDWRQFLNAVTQMGYALLITELDVRDNGLPADIAVRDRAVAEYTRGYLDVTLSYPAVRDVLSWGLCDRYSWIEGFEPRKDGARRRPSLYDTQFRPKPMREAVAAAFATATSR
ncbi:endo-1,4-beta-xylanase [Sphingomonas sp. BAUL-RG-20F-R05-02]|uniref:endo-1,4-beta-xylanase n=1 Tax=Sphingomonas sp. BAUL-RG-20F-R05-02 TaxID=2914830 RepID=UPI001F55D8E1|nr:endo-1,4-beta-xylanase [Sphingomonas sp. BAUL-RG-20F-R05-02]